MKKKGMTKYNILYNREQIKIGFVEKKENEYTWLCHN